MIETAERVGQLMDALAPIRVAVRDAVESDGPDEHQIEIDRLVWSHAHAEAAIASLEWAQASPDPFAMLLAETAYQYALSFIRSRDGMTSDGSALQMAQIADQLKPTDDLGASDDHRLLRSSIREFANREIRPRAREIHCHDLDVPEQIITGVAKLGLFGLSIPLTYGGSQETEDFVSMLVATEELSRASLAVGGSLMTRPEILVRALLRGGTDAQKRKWLPVIATGEKLVAVAVTESDFGSDVGGLKCRATRLENGDWVVNGTKLWCTFAGRSELVMVLCRTADTGHRGLSVFVVEKPPFKGREFEHRQVGGGTLRGRAIPTIGYRGMHTFELSFDEFRVPVDGLLGGEEWINRGFYLQMEGFAMGRIQTAGRAVGLMQAAVDDAVTYAKARQAFGKPVFTNQLIKSKIGRMVLLLNASRQVSYRAARMLNVGSGQTEAALAKLYASRASESVTRDAMQVYGAMGYSEETDVSRYFVDSRVLSIFEGTEEILSLRVVGKSIIERPS